MKIYQIILRSILVLLTVSIRNMSYITMNNQSYFILFIQYHSRIAYFPHSISTHYIIMDAKNCVKDT